MDGDIEKQIAERMAEIPADVRNAILASDLSSRVQAIGTKHQLHIDQIGELEDQIMLAMLGFSDLNMFSATIAAQIHIPKDAADTIAAEVNEQIFMTIRESMKHFTEVQPHASPVGMATPAPSAQTSVPATIPAVQLPAVTPAEKMLTEKTVVTSQVSAAPQEKPPAYKVDPYREPIE